MQRIPEAIALFQELIARAPNFAPALNYLGYLWIERAENLDRALDMVRKAVRLDPDNGSYVDSVGWGLFYWVVNIGAFVGHYLPSLLLVLSAVLPGALHADPNSPEAWRNLFLASAVFTSFNLFLLLAFKNVPSGASKTEPVWQVLRRTLTRLG